MRRVRGYTVIEMLTVLFIIVIVGALIAPGLGQLMKRSKVSSSVASVAGALRTARALAITTNDVYHVLAHTNGADVYASVVWLRLEDERYSVIDRDSPVWLVPGNYGIVDSARLEEKTQLTAQVGSAAPQVPGGPIAEFSWSPAVPHGGDEVQFIDQSFDTDGGEIEDWAWVFETQGGSTLKAPDTVSFITPGTYSVTLTVTDDVGNPGSATHTVVVAAAGQAAFLALSPTVFFWPDGSASEESVFTVRVTDPDEHDTPVRVRVRASGVVEELP